MAQVLELSPEVKREIMKVKTYALVNEVDLSAGVIPEDYTPAGDLPEHCCYSGNLRIVYSVELQKNVGKCHHLSVSKENSSHPHPVMVSEVMGLFGMGDLKDETQRKVWFEDGYAVNIVQPM